MVEFSRRIEREQGSDFKVLIVDDSQENQVETAAVVGKLGMTDVLKATGAFEALMAIRKGGIRLVLLDDQLGSGMTGGDILARVANWVEGGIIKKEDLPVFVGISATSKFDGLIPNVEKGRNFQVNLEGQLRSMMENGSGK